MKILDISRYEQASHKIWLSIVLLSFITTGCEQKNDSYSTTLSMQVHASYLSSVEFTLSNIRLITPEGDKVKLNHQPIAMRWFSGEVIAKKLANLTIPNNNYSDIAFDIDVQKLTFLDAYHAGETLFIDSLAQTIPSEKRVFSYRAQLPFKHDDSRHLRLIFDADRSISPLFIEQEKITALFNPLFRLDDTPLPEITPLTSDANLMVLADAKQQPAFYGRFSEIFHQIQTTQQHPINILTTNNHPASLTIHQLLTGQRIHAQLNHDSLDLKLLPGDLIGKVLSTTPLTLSPITYNHSPLTHIKSLQIIDKTSKQKSFAPAVNQLIRVRGISAEGGFMATALSLIDRQEVIYQMLLPLSLHQLPIKRITPDTIELDTDLAKKVHQVITSNGLTMNTADIASIQIQGAKVDIYIDRVAPGQYLKIYDHYAEAKQDLKQLLQHAAHINEIRVKGQLVDSVLIADTLSFTVYGSSILDSLYANELEEIIQTNQADEEAQNLLTKVAATFASLTIGMPLISASAYLIYKISIKESTDIKNSFPSPNDETQPPPTPDNYLNFNQWFLKNYENILKVNQEGNYTLNNLDVDDLINTNNMIKIQTMVDYLSAYNRQNGNYLFQIEDKDKQIDFHTNSILDIESFRQNIYLLPRHLQFHQKEVESFSAEDQITYYEELELWKDKLREKETKRITAFLTAFHQSDKQYAIMPILMGIHFNSIIFLKNADDQSITPIIVEPLEGEINAVSGTAQKTIALLPDSTNTEHPFNLQKDVKIINTGIQQDSCSCGPISAIGATAILEKIRNNGITADDLTPVKLNEIKQEIRDQPIFEPTAGHPNVRLQMIKAFDFQDQIESPIEKIKSIKFR
ncbi:MAG: hypothetical protein OXE99_13875 [Cellvibrionales bacterium]|nr:hypothetical protein [Cellvibrionales bacterium]